MNPMQLHNYLERLCNLLRVEARVQGAANGLLPVQMEALHYLARCNRYSDTAQALTEFLGQTKGTVSQTLKVLEARGLLRKRLDKEDRRVMHIRVTPAGQRQLAKAVPAPFLMAALRTMPPPRVEQLSADLDQLLRAAQHANQMKSFAACRTCRFNQKSDSGFTCGLTGESLREAELDLICREHEYPAAIGPA